MSALVRTTWPAADASAWRNSSAIGGLLVAAATYLTARLISPTLAEAVPFLILLAVMCWRPWGLFGTVEELNRV